MTRNGKGVGARGRERDRGNECSILHVKIVSGHRDRWKLHSEEIFCFFNYPLVIG